MWLLSAVFSAGSVSFALADDDKCYWSGGSPYCGQPGVCSRDGYDARDIGENGDGWECLWGVKTFCCEEGYYKCEPSPIRNWCKECVPESARTETRNCLECNEGFELVDGYCQPMCENNYAFVDQKGHTCQEWDGFSCELAMSKWGYTLEAMNAIFENCKYTCGFCADVCADNEQDPDTIGNRVSNPTWKDEKGKSCSDWEGSNCALAHDVHGYSIEGELELLDACRWTCKMCFGKCEDVRTYTTEEGALIEWKDEKGFACSEWKGHKCQDAMNRWGFSQEGQDELMKSCPASCGQCPEVEELTEDKTGGEVFGAIMGVLLGIGALVGCGFGAKKVFIDNDFGQAQDETLWNTVHGEWCADCCNICADCADIDLPL